MGRSQRVLSLGLTGSNPDFRDRNLVSLLQSSIPTLASVPVIPMILDVSVGESTGDVRSEHRTFITDSMKIT